MTPDPPVGSVWGAPDGRYCSTGPVDGRMPRGGDDPRTAPVTDTWVVKGPADPTAKTYYDTTWSECRSVVDVTAGVVTYDDWISQTTETATLADWATWATWAGDPAADALVVVWY